MPTTLQLVRRVESMQSWEGNSGAKSGNVGADARLCWEITEPGVKESQGARVGGPQRAGRAWMPGHMSTLALER